MAIIVSIIIIVAYCIYDRQRTNDRQKVKEINARIDSISKQVDVLCDNVNKLADKTGGIGGDDIVLPGQSHDLDG